MFAKWRPGICAAPHRVQQTALQGELTVACRERELKPLLEAL
jgi:hypothetical protein